MAQERRLTPEKQLLELIENPKDGGAKMQAVAAGHNGLSLLSFGAWSGRLSFFKDRLDKWFKAGGLSAFDAGIINNILGLIILVLVLYFIINFSASVVNLKKMPDRLNIEIQGGAKPVGAITEIPTSQKVVSYYVEKVRQRDIFGMGSNNKSESSVKAPSQRIIEATQNLKLAGISWSKDPDAMIEDTKALRTFFVKRGQMIGEVKIQAILKDKVILNYGGEEIELK